MKRRVALLLFAVLAAVGLYAGPSRAAPAHVVDDDDGACRYGEADHTSIQEAVTKAAEGDLVLVCPGRYVETVVVDKRLTIKGAKAGVDARTRDHTSGESQILAKGNGITVQLGADGIVFDGFLIGEAFVKGVTRGPGMKTDPDFSGYQIRNTVFLDNGLGLWLGASGEYATKVRHNLFSANNEFTAPNAGNGIYSDEGARCVLITENRFERHNGAGILFADRVGGDRNHQSCIWVERNQSIEDRTFAAFYASTHVSVKGNRVRSQRPDDPPDQLGSAIFVGARNHKITVAHNHIESTRGNGIDVRDTGAGANPDVAPTKVKVLLNKVANAGINGIDVFAPGVRQYVVRGNHVSASGEVGIHVANRAAQAYLANNVARNNQVFDCQDETRGNGTAGTANTWVNNAGDRNDPQAICKPERRKADGDHDDKPKKKKKKKKRCLPFRVRPV